ncbi:DUF5009 domain-containing protein [Haliscomenobacter hydrossis]|uniref:Uncharacterized protein n=1 Tax=Haliscomenobacter hydrossis (strain ATCC 27775 / DSM 1100 / LMG 10767 / O) TaxID=760192 RepID=F4L654_HALH1|nr:DUF5009 domain-containing protein [Haliscomenobacter hydrossis]AEE54072.1 Protein of unknown function DUF2261, transmembrane [Haliscomenobacter hydrossis DSM 1100]
MKNQRLPSIDILRAVTMLLMIFVNDLWSLTHVPHWLLHTAAEEDGMGLSDVVFPAFLFIVGLSIPHALKARLEKGASKGSVMLHILSRTFALLVMGLFMVNLENIDGAQLLIRKEYWQILMALAFMLIWNNYRSPMVFGVIPTVLLKILGWIILTFLAFIYQGASGNWMMIHWWGILGLIGWAYLLVALLYLWIGDKVWWLALACIVLLLLNVNEFVRLLGFDFQLVISASTHVSVLLGVLTTVIYGQLAAKDQLKWLIPSLIGLSILLIVFGFATRLEWGISKIRATPSWTTICAGISILAFVLLHFIADVKEQTRWAAFIAPAGSSTLTCYLMPYFAYAFVALLGWSLPAVMTDGVIGLLKSTLFALLIIQVTGMLNRVQIGLKI